MIPDVTFIHLVVSFHFLYRTHFVGLKWVLRCFQSAWSRGSKYNPFDKFIASCNESKTYKKTGLIKQHWRCIVWRQQCNICWKICQEGWLKHDKLMKLRVDCSLSLQGEKIYNIYKAGRYINITARHVRTNMLPYRHSETNIHMDKHHQKREKHSRTCVHMHILIWAMKKLWTFCR